MQSQRIKAFTLVELIIVITILAILRTIGFMSFQTYTGDTRDTKRKTDLGVIRKGLEIYQMKNQKLPNPDNYVNISSGGTLSLQGYAGMLTLKILRISEETQDLKDNKYYTYSVSTDKTKYQLLAMLEKQENLAYNQKYINQANAIDYTRRFPYTIGQKIGIYLSGTTNTPIQEGNSGATINVTTGSDYRIITENSGAIINTPRVNTCTSWTYNTGACTIDGTAPLTIATSSPNGCTGGTPLTTTSCAYTCPTGYVLVPKDGIFTTQNFCVMKYEAKITGNNVGTTTYNASMTAESRSSGTPWVNITQPQAITECNSLGVGYHLITNNEWMTIARNIEANSQNWANGTTGSLVSAGGGLYRGNTNESNSVGCGSNTVLDGDTRGTNCVVSSRNKRVLKLTNGNDIWDISGNVREHVNGTNNKTSIDGVVANGNACGDTAWHSWNSSNDGTNNSCAFTNTSPMNYSKSNYGPLGDYNALNGVGRIYSSTGINKIFIRGGSWGLTDTAGIFLLHLDDISTDIFNFIGFRCAFN